MTSALGPLPFVNSSQHAITPGLSATRELSQRLAAPSDVSGRRVRHSLASEAESGIGRDWDRNKPRNLANRNTPGPDA